MNTITETFNEQAADIILDIILHNIFLIPLWILLMELAAERRDKAKRKRLDNQQRGFYRADIKKARRQYERQVQARCPTPQFRVTSPHF